MNQFSFSYVIQRLDDMETRLTSAITNSRHNSTALVMQTPRAVGEESRTASSPHVHKHGQDLECVLGANFWDRKDQESNAHFRDGHHMATGGPHGSTIGVGMPGFILPSGAPAATISAYGIKLDSDLLTALENKK